MNKSKAKPTHPGRELAACLEQAHMTQADLANQISVSEQTISDIINGKASITIELAILLSVIFKDKDPKFWILKQAIWNCWNARNNSELHNNVALKMPGLAAYGKARNEAILKDWEASEKAWAEAEAAKANA